MPADRIILDLPFKIIGTDYAGRFLCKSKGKKERKVHLLLFLSRAIHLEVLPDQNTQEFLHGLKRLSARRGKPKVIYSDNAKTFVTASNWIEKINKDELMQEYLIKGKIQWKFQLSKASWRGWTFREDGGACKTVYV